MRVTSDLLAARYQMTVTVLHDYAEIGVPLAGEFRRAATHMNQQGHKVYDAVTVVYGQRECTLKPADIGRALARIKSGPVENMGESDRQRICAAWETGDSERLTVVDIAAVVEVAVFGMVFYG